MTGWQFDTTKTQERYDRLQAYYQKHQLNPEAFGCKHYAACSGSQKEGTVEQYAGGTAGLMPFYDVSYKGAPIRVFIVGKEASYNPSREFGAAPNFDARTEECLKTVNASKKTSHIKGTLLALQRVFEVESEYAYACYALGNALRCAFQRAEVAKNTSGLRDTRTMRMNCSRYLIDEIEILEPTLIITQGAWAVSDKPPLVNRIAEALGVQPKRLMENAENGYYGLYEFPNFMLITSHHPARLGVWKAQYAPDSLWPMIDRLKSIGYLPTIAQADAENFEQLIQSLARQQDITLES